MIDTLLHYSYSNNTPIYRLADLTGETTERKIFTYVTLNIEEGFSLINEAFDTLTDAIDCAAQTVFCCITLQFSHLNTVKEKIIETLKTRALCLISHLIGAAPLVGQLFAYKIRCRKEEFAENLYGSQPIDLSRKITTNYPLTYEITQIPVKVAIAISHLIHFINQAPLAYLARDTERLDDVFTNIAKIKSIFSHLDTNHDLDEDAGTEGINGSQ